MVIRFAAHDGHGPVNLLDEEKPHHLVCERHARERQLGVGTLVDLFRESVRTADDENQAFGALDHPALYHAGKFP